MKKIVIFVLALLIAIASFSVLFVANGPLKDLASDKETTAATDVVSDTTILDSETVPVEHEFALRFGDPGFDDLIYVVKGDQARIGVIIPTREYGSEEVGLQYSSSYQMHWNLSQAFMLQTSAEFAVEVIDGVSTPCVYYDKAYSPNSGLGDRLLSTDLSILPLLNGNNGDGWSIQTGAKDETTVFFMFAADYESPEQMKVLLDTLVQYINDLYFIGPIGG